MPRTFLIYESNNWRLSPAYDLVPNSGFTGNHSSTISGKGKPTIDDIYKVAKQCGLELKLAKKIFDEVYFNCSDIRMRNW